ncbi:unnamed protein product [Xylocopa violacea]|uniref:28S ribosomal protein S22, mitochondrial n=1 Tax=Xylocopa violacea TaxID=135666 RepID=A0ABP1NSR5_XYLVO
MSGRLNFLFRHHHHHHHLSKRPTTWNSCRRFCSSTVPEPKSRTEEEKDPAPIFFDRYVQQLLMTLTRIDYRKVFAARRDGTRLNVPKYKFMTDEELQQARAQIEAKAKGRIQMPPVVKIRSENVEILSDDPGLQDFTETTNVVFTDISFGGNNRNRLIVVREPSGTLRHATSNERHRMNQVYFPIQGREVHTPQMFRDPYLNDLLKREEFEFVLDRACLQFEPDDPEYHRVTREVYSRLNALKKFDTLRSTRHFGPFAFHLAWEKSMDALLVDLLKNHDTEEAAALIRLYHRIHPEAESAKEPIRDDIDLIRAYAELDSSKRNMITNAIKVHQTLLEQKNKMKEGLMKAHGFQDEEIEQT